MKYKNAIPEWFKQSLFPKFTEIQYFTLISGLVLLLFFSPIVRSETANLFTQLLSQSSTFSTYLILAVQLFIIALCVIQPIHLAFRLISGKKLDAKTKEIACIYYYSLFGLLAMLSINSQYNQLDDQAGLPEKLNVLLTLVVLIVLSIRWFILIFISKLDDPKVRAFQASRLSGKQYHWMYFALVVAGSTAIMWFLQFYYSHPATLVFLTVSYTLIFINAISKVLHSGYH